MNTKLKCVKCGSECIKVEWHKAGDKYRCETKAEHLHMTCGCGYSWTTPTEDNIPPKPGPGPGGSAYGAVPINQLEPCEVATPKSNPVPQSDEATWELDSVRKLANELNTYASGRNQECGYMMRRASRALDWCASQLAEQRNLTIKWQDEARHANIRMGKEHSEVVGLHEQLRIASKDAKLERNAYNELSVKHHDLVRHHESDHTMIQDQRKDISKMEKQV